VAGTLPHADEHDGKELAAGRTAGVTDADPGHNDTESLADGLGRVGRPCEPRHGLGFTGGCHGNRDQGLAGQGRQPRKETEDLEKWILTEPTILGDDIIVIGSQVPTRSGPLDLLGIDFEGNTVIVELKRDMIPREAVAQAIDYASDVASWDIPRLSEACQALHDQPLEEFLGEHLPDDVPLDALTLNQSQRLLVVGTSIEEPLQRMIEWLSDSYQMPVNALLLTYIKTESGDELLARTMVIPEEVERQAARQRRGFEMDDTPGQYEDGELRQHLTCGSISRDT